MKEEFKRSIYFYLIAYSLAGLTYWKTADDYVHGPGFFIILIFLIAIIGAIWLAVAIVLSVIGHKYKNSADIIVNGINTIGIVLTILIVFQREPKSEIHNKNSDEWRVEQNGDSSVLYHNDNLIYLRVADSVYMDFRDSDLIEKTKLEYPNL